jgi:PAS domain S-box-containing protein
MKLKNHDLFVSTLLKTIPVPIFYKDTKCRYLGCNRAFSEFIGVGEPQIIGKTVFDISPADIATRHNAQDQHLLANPGSQSYEWKLRNADDVIRTLIFNKATYTDADGQLTGIVSAMLDITELKELQSTMQQAREAAEEANRARSEFLANMSHADHPAERGDRHGRTAFHVRTT